MPKPKMPPKCVIFDCDGVLVDTEGPVNEVIATKLSLHGPDITGEELRQRFVGSTVASIGERAAETGYDLPPDWVEGVYEAVFERLSSGVELIPGIVEVLDALDEAGIPYCVGSNGPMEKMEITLGQTGLMDRLRGRIFSPHVIGLEHAKPSGGLYLHAAKTMGVNTADCVVIEDTVSGSRGARNAGIFCFGITRDTDAELLEAEGAQTFSDMSELPVLLGLE